MPRKKRCRRVCEEPDFPVFRPAGRVSGGISMTVDEFETIRLVDYEQKTHEECAALMDVSRTTVTEIYQSARAKIAKPLGDRLPLFPPCDPFFSLVLPLWLSLEFCLFRQA